MKKINTFFIILVFFFLNSQSFAQWQSDQLLTPLSMSWGGGPGYLSFSRSIATTNNVVHTVWHDIRDGNWEIYYKRSIDGGVSWGADTRLTFNGAQSDQVSITAKGNNVYIVWHDTRDGNLEIYFKQSNDQGLTWSQDIRLTNNSSNSYNATIAVAGSFIYTTWYDERDGNREIYFKRSNDAGLNWEADVRLSNSAGQSEFPSISASGNSVNIAWVDDRDGNTEIYNKNSFDNGSTWSNELRVTNNTFNSQNPSITSSGDNVYLVYGDDRNGPMQIFYKRSLNRGLSWEPETILVQNGYTNFRPIIEVSGSNVYLVWFVHYPWMIYYKMSTNAGSTWSEDTYLTTPERGQWNAVPALTFSGSTIHVLWNDYAYIYYKRNPTLNSTSLALSYPIGGAILAPGSQVNISWTSNQIQNIKIELSLNGTNYLTTPISPSVTASTGSFLWTVPNNLSSQCKIRISDVNNPSLSSTSNIFSISNITNLNNGLIAYYPLDQDANDYSGNNNNGTLSNTPDFVSGRIGNGVKIFGIEQNGGNGKCVLLPSSINNSINLLNNFTISLWVKEESLISSGGEGYFFLGNHNFGWVGISHFYNPTINAGQINFSVGANAYMNPAPILVPYDDNFNNNFVLYTLTYQNGLLKAYINGSLVGQINQTVNLQSPRAALGRHWWGDGDANYSSVLRGVIDDVRIYDRVITQSEINQLYSQNANISIISPTTGDVCIPNSQYQIKWQSNGVQNVKIELSDNNGASWLPQPITSNYPAAAGSFQWSVNNINKTTCKIKITDVSNLNVSKISNSFTIKPVPISNGLIVYYPFDNNFNDASGNNNNSTKEGNPTIVPGLIGNAVKFVSDPLSNCELYSGGDRLRMPTINLNIPAFTISMWVNDNSINCGAETYFFQGDDITGYGNIAIWHHFSNLIFTVDGIQNRIQVPFRESDNNRFVLYTMVYSNGILKAYRDEELLGQLTQNVNYSTLFTGLGSHAWSGNSSARFNGKIDDFRIYNRAISESEIHNLYTLSPIISNPNITLTSPDANAIWQGGSTQYVQWNSVNIQNVKIELSVDNGAYMPIGIQPAIYNSFSWNVPSINSQNCKIKVSDLSNPNNYFISSEFSISSSTITQEDFIRLKFNDPLNEIKKVQINSHRILNLGYEKINPPLKSLKRQVTNNQYFFKKDEIDSLFPNSAQRIYEIVLFGTNDEALGHINFDYRKTDYVKNKKVDCILYLEGKKAEQLNDYCDSWKYFKSPSERLVYMLIPPSEKFDSIRINKEPMLFVHGIYGVYPYWGDVPNQIYSESEAWQLYYPYDMRIDDCSDILKKGIENILSGNTGVSSPYLFPKVNVTAHSMGGLVVRNYLQKENNPKVKKLLMLSTPNNGSLSSYNARHEFSGKIISEIDLKKDSKSPAHIDMSPGSNFLNALNFSPLKVLFGDLLKSYLVIAGSKHLSILKYLHYEAKDQDDGVVAISSASLLNKGIPLGTCDFDHLDICYSISPSILVNFFNEGYFPVLGNIQFDNINQNNQIHNFYKDYQTNLHSENNDFIKDKSIVYLDMSQIKSTSKMSLNHLFANNYSVNVKDNFFHSDTLFQKNAEEGIHFLWKTTKYEEIGLDLFYLNNLNPTINLTFLNGDVSITKSYSYKPFQTNWLSYLNPNRSINFTEVEQFLLNTTINLSESNFLKKTNLNKLDILEKSFLIDTSVDTVSFFLKCNLNDKAFRNSNFKLLDPNNTLIDSNSVNLNKNIFYNKDGNNFVEYYYIVNPIEGEWKVQYNTNIINPLITVPVSGKVSLSIESIDSSYYLGDSVKCKINVFGLSNINGISINPKIYFRNSELDSFHLIQNPNIYSLNDSLYIESFMPQSVGEYKTIIEYNYLQNNQARFRKSNFIVKVQKLQTPKPIYPKIDSLLTPINLTLGWSQSLSSTKYNVEIYKVGDSVATLKNNNILDTTVFITNLINGQVYLWRVKALNKVDSSDWSEFNSFETINNKPLAPSLIAPPDNISGCLTSVSFCWNNISNSQNYNLLISSDTLFQNLILNDSTILDTVKTINGLNRNVKYYWKVRAINDGGSSPYTPFRNFRTLGMPTTTNLIQPANNTVNQPIVQAFRWNKSVDQFGEDKSIKVEKNNNTDKKGNVVINISEKGNGHGNTIDYVSKYSFELVTDTIGMSNKLLDSTIVDTIKVVSNLSYNKSYYWRIKAFNEAGWNDFGVWNKFTTIDRPYTSINATPPLGNNSTAFGPTNLILNANISSTSNVNVSYYTVPPILGIFPAGINYISNYYWYFQDSGITFSNGIIKIALSNIAGVTDSSSLHWLKRTYAGDDWTDIGGVINNGYLESTVIFNSFSEFAIGSIDNQPLTSSYFNVKVIPSGFFNISSNKLNKRDTLRGYLMDISSPTSIIDSAIGILDSVTFNVFFDFKKASSGTYFLKIKHNNSLETWSKLGGENFTKYTTMVYDFTVAQNKTYGNNSVLISSNWCMITGDIDQDGYVNGNDFTVFSQQFGASGYLRSDLNGDGVINGDDFTYFSQSFGKQSVYPGAVMIPSDQKIKKRKLNNSSK
ncbi:hypothetical protein BH10BAC5_BH10BAC5_21100 [soil metagenome]